MSVIILTNWLKWCIVFLDSTCSSEFYVFLVTMLIFNSRLKFIFCLIPQARITTTTTNSIYSKCNFFTAFPNYFLYSLWWRHNLVYYFSSLLTSVQSPMSVAYALKYFTNPFFIYPHFKYLCFSIPHYSHGFLQYFLMCPEFSVITLQTEFMLL